MNLNMNTPNINSNNNPYYFCYSINLLRFIRDNNIENIAKGINPKTNRTYWMFLRNNKLDTILNQWSR